MTKQIHTDYVINKMQNAVRDGMRLTWIRDAFGLAVYGDAGKSALVLLCYGPTAASHGIEMRELAKLARRAKVTDSFTKALVS